MRVLALVPLLFSCPAQGFVSPKPVTLIGVSGGSIPSKIQIDHIHNKDVQPLSFLAGNDNIHVGKARTVLAATGKQASSSESSDSDAASKYWGPLRVACTVAYVALVIYGFGLAPGQLGSPDDVALIDKILADPVNPGINEIYYTLFNIFTAMPIILAALTLPQAPKEGLPPSPFLLLAAFLGYFTAGPYFIFRKQPVLSSRTRSDLGWITRNVLENKVFAIFTVLLTAAAIAAPNAWGAYQADPAGTWQGFVDVMTSSRFCAVSGADLFILYLLIIGLTPGDYRLRKPEASDSEALIVAALSALVPYLGSAIYMTLRPSLPEE